MKDLLCEFSHRFPSLVAEILHRDRHKRRNFREETITDVLMAGLISFEHFGVRVDFPQDESKTGEDMDWEFVAPHAVDGRRYLRLHIQAKRAIQSKTKTPYWYYRELDHAVPAGAKRGSQHEILLKEADPNEGCLPIYMFYHPIDALDPSHSKLPAIAGVNVLFADEIPVRLSVHHWPIADKRVDKWRPRFMSLSQILCFGHLLAPPFPVPNLGLLFLSGDSIGLISPGEIVDRLNSLRESSIERPRVRAVNEIPAHTLRAIEAGPQIKMSAEIDRPRIIFYTSRA